jgi:hypothetical protein
VYKHLLIQGASVATVYVSYKSNEEKFVTEVVTRIETLHEVFIDYKMPVGGLAKLYA